MGTKDAYQHSYLDDPVRFADQVNGALFGGRQVVKAKELQEADPGLVYNGREGSSIPARLNVLLGDVHTMLMSAYSFFSPAKTRCFP